MLKNKKCILICAILAFICLLILGTIYILMYKGLASTIPFLLLFLLLTSSILDLFRKKVAQERFLLPFGALIIIVSIVIFVVSLSPVSYPEAKRIAVDNGLVDLSKSPFDVTFASELPTSNSVANCYLFTGKLKGTEVYFMVSPVDGSIQIEVVGESYLDGVINSIGK